MNHKTIMIDSDVYSKLSAAKDKLQNDWGIKLSYGDLLNDLVSNRLDLQPINKLLREYVEKFTSLLVESGLVSGVLLFGSVAKGTWDKFSDIDILLCARGSKEKVLKGVIPIIRSLQSYRNPLIKAGLPSLISPVILDSEDLDSFVPFYFDFADYGITVYEGDSTLRNFLHRIRFKKHERLLVKNSEVLTW